MPFTVSYRLKTPKLLRKSGFRISYRKKLGAGGTFLLALCWMFYAVFWLAWWELKLLYLSAVWLVQVLVRLIRRERPLFPRFFPGKSE